MGNAHKNLANIDEEANAQQFARGRTKSSTTDNGGPEEENKVSDSLLVADGKVSDNEEEKVEALEEESVDY